MFRFAGTAAGLWAFRGQSPPETNPTYKKDTSACKKRLSPRGILLYHRNRTNFNTGPVFKAVALAMGVAVTVLSCLGSLEPQTAVSLLGIGLACAGAAMLSKN